MTVGDTSPRGYLRGSPLDTPFVSFLVKGKIPRCGARSSTKGRFAEILVRSKVSNFSLLPHNKVTSNFRFCGLVPPTLALTFLLREKSAKAYPRGGVLLDISSGGNIPRSHFVTLPLVYHETFLISLVFGFPEIPPAERCFS